MPERETDNLFVRKVLWDFLPEERRIIVDLEQEEAEFFWDTGGEGRQSSVNHYTLASAVLVGGAFERLFADASLDEDLARRCAQIVECLLSEERSDVRDMVSLRVTDYLLGYVQPWLRFKGFAGPLLRQEVDSRKEYYTGPF